MSNKTALSFPPDKARMNDWLISESKDNNLHILL